MKAFSSGVGLGFAAGWIVALLLLTAAPCPPPAVQTVYQPVKKLGHVWQGDDVLTELQRVYEVPDRTMSDIWYAAVQGGLTPRLVFAVVRIESGFNPSAISSKGAVGLMQVEPETACEMDAEGCQTLASPITNLRLGVRYLRANLEASRGNLELALRSYNAGPRGARRDPTVGEEYAQAVLQQANN